MGKSVYYELFNEKLEEFFKELIVAFPDISEFRKFKSGLTLLKNVNSKTPQIIFNEYVATKFKDALLAKDETFFLDNDDYGITVKKDYWNEFIVQLKLLWTNINQNNKDVIWKYLNLLYILNEKCIV